MLTLSAQGNLRVWDFESGKLLSTFSTEGEEDASFCFAVSPDRSFLVTGRGNQLKVWPFITRKELLSLKRHSKPVTSVSVDYGAAVGASSGEDGLVLSWDLKGRKVNHEFIGHEGNVNVVRISP